MWLRCQTIVKEVLGSIPIFSTAIKFYRIFERNSSANYISVSSMLIGSTQVLQGHCPLVFPTTNQPIWETDRQGLFALWCDKYCLSWRFSSLPSKVVGWNKIFAYVTRNATTTWTEVQEGRESFLQQTPTTHKEWSQIIEDVLYLFFLSYPDTYGTVISWKGSWELARDH